MVTSDGHLPAEVPNSFLHIDLLITRPKIESKGKVSRSFTVGHTLSIHMEYMCCITAHDQIRNAYTGHWMRPSSILIVCSSISTECWCEPMKKIIQLNMCGEEILGVLRGAT